MRADAVGEGWDGLGDGPAPVERVDEVARAFARCFGAPGGSVVLDHLRRVFLERRLGPAASDAELRHVEGQRSVVAHLLAMIERGRMSPANRAASKGPSCDR